MTLPCSICARHRVDISPEYTDKGQMRKTVVFILALFLLTMITPSIVCPTPPPPRPPYNKRAIRPDAAEVERAVKLYELARRENRRLTWISCLARAALRRAKQLVTEGYFDHKDPKTGRNPVWPAIERCCACRSAGENLTEGMDSPENIHEALMESPLHRKNILDPRFNLMGIGCYDYVCVELFAGL